MEGVKSSAGLPFALAHLPPEVLDQITRLLSIYQSCRLFLTGNLAIRSKLANGGITRLVNYEHRKSVPALLSEFVSAISLDQRGEDIPLGRDTTTFPLKMLQRLPKYLRELALCFKVNVGDLCSVLPELATLRVLEFIWTGFSGPISQNLLELTIERCPIEAVPLLPSSLITLDVRLQTAILGDELIEGLDFRRFSQLNSLTVRCCPCAVPPSICPSTLSYLHLHIISGFGFNTFEFSSIPTTVTDFALFAEDSDIVTYISRADVSLLNRNMTSLVIRAGLPLVMLHDAWEAMPPALTNLELFDLTQTYPPLDPSIIALITAKTLRINLIISIPADFQAPYLQGLTTLELASRCLLRVPLPSTLTCLRLAWVERDNLEVLFSNLMDSRDFRVLSLNIGAELRTSAGTPLVHFPRHLTSLKISAKTTWFPLTGYVPPTLELFHLNMGDAIAGTWSAPPNNWISFVATCPRLHELQITAEPLNMANLAYLKRCTSLKRLNVICTDGRPQDIISSLPPSLEYARLCIDETQVNWARFVTALSTKLPKLRFLKFDHSSVERFTPFPPRLLKSLPTSLTQFYLVDDREDNEMKRKVAAQLGICVTESHPICFDWR